MNTLEIKFLIDKYYYIYGQTEEGGNEKLDLQLSTKMENFTRWIFLGLKICTDL
jgi:hypothetical protein